MPPPPPPRPPAARSAVVDAGEAVVVSLAAGSALLTPFGAWLAGDTPGGGPSPEAIGLGAAILAGAVGVARRRSPLARAEQGGAGRFGALLACALGLTGVLLTRDPAPAQAEALRVVCIPLGAAVAVLGAPPPPVPGPVPWLTRAAGGLAAAIAVAGAVLAPGSPRVINPTSNAFLVVLLVAAAAWRGRPAHPVAAARSDRLRAVRLGGVPAFAVHFGLAVLAFLFLPVRPLAGSILLLAAVTIQAWSAATAATAASPVLDKDGSEVVA